MTGKTPSIRRADIISTDAIAGLKTDSLIFYCCRHYASHVEIQLYEPPIEASFQGPAKARNNAQILQLWAARYHTHRRLYHSEDGILPGSHPDVMEIEQILQGTYENEIEEN
jgi:hypothetical protein